MDGKQTEIIDEIEFELPYGILGRLFEGYAYKQLHHITLSFFNSTLRLIDDIKSYNKINGLGMELETL